MIYSQEIEDQIAKKMTGKLAKTRTQAISYAKMFWPDVAQQMVIEEANYKLNTINQEDIDTKNGVDEQMEQFLYQEDLRIEHEADMYSDMLLAMNGEF